MFLACISFRLVCWGELSSSFNGCGVAFYIKGFWRGGLCFLFGNQTWCQLNCTFQYLLLLKWLWVDLFWARIASYTQAVSSHEGWTRNWREKEGTLLRLSCENAISTSNDFCAFPTNQPHVIPEQQTVRVTVSEKTAFLPAVGSSLLILLLGR